MDERHSRDSGHGGHDPQRPAKRRKVALACVECRTRKVRCDGVHPVCGACLRRSDQCVYSIDSERKRAIEREYFIGLENRIRELERERGDSGSSSAFEIRVRELDELTHTDNNLHTQPSQQHSENVCVRPVSGSQTLPLPFSYQNGQKDNTQSGLWASQSGENPSSALTNACLHRNGDQQCLSPTSTRERPREEEIFDGVNAMMGAVEEERPTHGFFGSSSAASFMKQIKTAVEEKVSSPESRPSDLVFENIPRSTLMSRPKKNAQVKVADYVLPPRKTADSLMEVYWNLVFPLYPLVDRAQISAEYEKIWIGKSLDCDENMLMWERRASADVFFSRAKELLHFNLWNSGSAELIQCLLLMGQYLQSTDSAHQCWIVIGLAVRNAQSLGLHLPQTISRFQSVQEQQLARKIWHGCVLMDRVVSMTFGRPAMASKASGLWVPLPATIDDEFISLASGKELAQPDNQPDNQPSMMTFFARSLELYEILNDILLSLYMPGPEGCHDDIHNFYFHKKNKEGEREIFELDRALAKWCRKLPPHLRDSSCDGYENPIFRRQAIVLRARFLHVRILLFRPTLSRCCTARDITSEDPLISLDDSFPQRVTLQCSIICVKVAQEVIELIFNNIPSNGSTGSLPAWCPNTERDVYTAATVLIAGRLRSAILSEVTESAITRSWNCALEILRKYQGYSTSARRCVAALEILYGRVASEGHPSRAMMMMLPNDQPCQDVPLMPAPNALNDMSFGEGTNAAVFDSFNLADLQDMSWLNSVPSNLY